MICDSRRWPAAWRRDPADVRNPLLHRGCVLPAPQEPPPVASQALALAQAQTPDAQRKRARAAGTGPAVDTGPVRQALEGGRYPWYDSGADRVRPVWPALLVAEVAARTNEGDSASAIDRFFKWLGWQPEAGPSRGLRRDWLGTILLATVLAAFLRVLARALAAPRAVRAGASAARASPEPAQLLDQLPEDLRPGLDDPWAEAQRRRAAGDFAGAVIYLFAHQLLSLDRAGLIRLLPGWTGRQYVRWLRDPVLVDSLGGDAAPVRGDLLRAQASFRRGLRARLEPGPGARGTPRRAGGVAMNNWLPGAGLPRALRRTPGHLARLRREGLKPSTAEPGDQLERNVGVRGDCCGSAATPSAPAVRLTEELAEWAEGIVRFAPHPGPPEAEEARWFRHWLARRPRAVADLRRARFRRVRRILEGGPGRDRRIGRARASCRGRGESDRGRGLGPASCRRNPKRPATRATGSPSRAGPPRQRSAPSSRAFGPTTWTAAAAAVVASRGDQVRPPQHLALGRRQGARCSTSR